MKLTVQVTLEPEDGTSARITEITCLDRADLTPATLGLTLAEAKQVLSGLQATLTTAQITAYNEAVRACPACGTLYNRKSTRTVTVRTLFGKVRLSSPRFYTCACQAASIATKSFSPLAAVLPDRTTPEFMYLQTEWAALISYGLTARLLAEVFPLEKPVSTAVLTQQVQRAADRLDAELGPEQPMFIDGCPREWAALPDPPAPLTVGLDGGHVHGRAGANRKAGTFEVIVGKGLPTDGASKRFGYVTGYDPKPKRRLFEMLRSQGMAANQQVLFLTDGGDTVRDLPLYMNPQSEHILDWFHIAMRLTLLGQLAKGIPPPPALAGCRKPEAEDEEEAGRITAEQIATALERVKWFLWHGNSFSALDTLQDLEMDLEASAGARAGIKKLDKAVQEFTGYITANQAFLVNYGDRYRNGEHISSSFVEATVNELISKRMVKKQQMRWTKAGAHRVLQIRVQVWDGDLQPTFRRWYPGMPASELRSDPLRPA